MIIIRMKGGLGNQMFQYALYSQLSDMGREVKMDDVTGFREDLQRNPALSVFGIDYKRASREEVIRITDSYMDFPSRVRRKIFGRKTLEYEEKKADFDPKVLECRDAYLVGFWQTERYFPEKRVRDRLRQEFLQKREEILQGTAEQKLLLQMRQEQSVSIHVRRGDYLTPGTVETFGGICTDDYYEKAQSRILQNYPDAVFYVFSNETEWAREHFRGGKYITVDCRCESADAAELYLMSSCRHHILANSSFSWWSAWLGEHGADHMIFAPDRWLNNKIMTDIYTEDMIRISSEK